jgi:hypothetical protein
VTRNYLSAALLVCLCAVLFYPGFLFHWEAAKDPYVFGDDARQYLPVFDNDIPGSSVPLTYTKQYYRDTLMLPGFRALYKFAAVHGDTHSLARILTYLLYLCTVALLAAAAWKVGGLLTAACVLVLSLSTSFMLQWGYIGGTSRMFAYTFIALALWALAAGRPLLLAGCTAVAALFYPLAAAVCGLTLAMWLLLMPERAQGKVAGWSWPQKLSLLTITASLTLAAVLPTMLEGGNYGRRVVGEDVADWPEASAQGRYTVYGDAVPYPLMPPGLVVSYFFEGLTGNGSPILPAVSLRRSAPQSVLVLSMLALYVVVFGLIRLIKYRPSSVRVLLPFAAAIVLHCVAVILQPMLYIPGRYLVYTVPLWACFLFPLGLYGIAIGRTGSRAQRLVWLPVLAVFILWGGRGDAHTPWTIVIPEPERKFYQQISALPEHSLIAGWPGSAELADINLDNIAFLTRRNVLLNHETHQVLHFDYMARMRERMEDVVAAYFSSDLSELMRLKEKYGVTHVLVDTNHFAGTPPVYFSPWDSERIKAEMKASNGPPLLADRALHNRAGIIRHDSYILLDLARLDPPF